MQQELNYLRRLVSQGGPKASESGEFGAFVEKIASRYRSGIIGPAEISDLRGSLGDVLTPATLYGHTYRKPYGYAGDFEIIDKIYRSHESSDERFRKWDQNYNSTHATHAVRNRKEYMVRLLRKSSEKAAFQVLDIASGPARDLYEFFSSEGASNAEVDCVEYDRNAIVFASDLCREYLSKIRFHHANAFRYRPTKSYDLIWSAGLFDYFDGDRFKFLLKRLLQYVKEGGELVIGNFSDRNPTRAYMEILGDWILHHRSPEKLISLAEECGIDKQSMRVESEPEGVNLFLHIQKQ